MLMPPTRAGPWLRQAVMPNDVRAGTGPSDEGLTGAARARDGRPTLADTSERILLRLPIGVVLVDRGYDMQLINLAARRALEIHGTAVDRDFVHLASGARQRRAAQRNEEVLVGSEEVQAATEEVETLNEELQATNEELETLDEELQATVEELNTTNDDLEARSAELEGAASVMRTVQAAREESLQNLATGLLGATDGIAVIDRTGAPVMETKLLEVLDRLSPLDGEPAIGGRQGLRARALRGERLDARSELANGGRRRRVPIVRDPIRDLDGRVMGVVLTTRPLRRGRVATTRS